MNKYNFKKDKKLFISKTSNINLSTIFWFSKKIFNER